MAFLIPLSRLLFFLAILGVGNGLHLRQFYKFGTRVGDAELRTGSVGFTRINLASPVFFCGEEHASLYVNLDGVISFDKPVSQSSKYGDIKTRAIFHHRKYVAPFYVDAKRNDDVSVLYRKTKEKMLLSRATTDVRARFPSQMTFQASNVFIATWVVKNQQKTKANSFQVVIVYNSNKTFVLFCYENLGIRTKTVFPYVGFSCGNKQSEHRLPGSGTKDVYLLSESSNVNHSGKWLYVIGSQEARERHVVSAQRFAHKNNYPKIGNKRCYHFKNITSYRTYERPIAESSTRCAVVCGQAGFPIALFHYKNGCQCADNDILDSSYIPWYGRKCKGKNVFMVYRTRMVMMGDEATQGDSRGCSECHQNAKCDSPTRCCVCKSGYYGNGQYCLQNNQTSHMFGTLYGTFNNVELTDGKLSVFADYESATTYVSVYSVSESVGWLLRAMMPMVTTPAYYFAFSSGGTGRNGYQIFGENFVRRAKVSFETGEICYIREEISGQDESGRFYFSIRLTGNIPSFPENASIKFDNYLHSYRYDDTGMMSGYYHSQMKVDNRAHTLKVVEIYEFSEVKGCSNISEFKVAVSEQKSSFDQKDNIVRYKLVADPGDPDFTHCGKSNRNCHADAHCAKLEDDGIDFCSCNKGFAGNGYKCKDINECLLNAHDCSANAYCVNNAGSFSCTCKTGYLGDGKNCIFVEGLCGVEKKKCAPNSECVSKNGVEKCECVMGFSALNDVCKDYDECFWDIHNCSLKADCNNAIGSYICVCRSGYEGDGRTCTLSADGSGTDGCNPDGSQCATNEVCVDRKCVCPRGFLTGISSCEDENECELGTFECDTNGVCVNTIGSFTCACNKGYTGDGFKCDPQDEDECQLETHTCDKNAACANTVGSFKCTCTIGYSGNGHACEDKNECDLNTHTCDKNAACANTVGSYKCICNDGFSGDGYQCKELEGCGGVRCDKNANCVKQDSKSTCVCKRGYEGNGQTCADANECVGNVCQQNEQCKNFPGTYSCECKPGYKRKEYYCERVYPCQDVKCGSGARCVVQKGSAVCLCKPGYYGKHPSCLDFNECKTKRDQCHSEARCVNIPGAYKCYCLPGYIGDGFDCQSDGSCGGVKCHKNAQCLDVNDTKHCKCDAGFVGSGLVCADFDECVEASMECPEFSRCTNTYGSYECSCMAGYKWDGVKCIPVCSRCRNGGTCNGTKCICSSGYSGDRCQWAGDQFLVFSQGSTIKRTSIPPQQQNVGVLYTIPGLIVAIDYDYKNKLIYFTDAAGKALWRVRFNGTGAEKIVTKGISSPEGIAVDYLAGNIYWTDSQLDRLEVAKLDGSERKVLFKTRLINPRSIVVHPRRGTMYWADWNRAAPKIEVAHMDGGSRRLFIDQEIGLPNGLTIDMENQELCWTDAGEGSISCAKLDDGKLKVVVPTASYPFGLTLFGKYLFWTEWNTSTINQYNKLTSEIIPAVISTSNGLYYGIKSIQPTRHTDDHPCTKNNGGCSNLCLIRPGGITCTCPTGYHLQEKDEFSGSGSGESGFGQLGPSVFTGSGQNSGSGSGSASGVPPGISGPPSLNITAEKLCVKNGKNEFLRRLL